MDEATNPRSAIFIDGDGTWRWITGFVAFAPPMAIVDGINHHSIELLNHLAEETGSRFVISSSWRVGVSAEEAIQENVKHGFKQELFHPSDPCTGKVLRKRSDEIAEWLSRHPEVENYVAIDDERLRLVQSVKVDGNIGFNIYNYNHSCRLLGKPEKQQKLSYYSPRTARQKAKLLDAKPS